MARKRMIDPDFWTDEKITELSIPTRLLFIGTWNFADDEGRYNYSPKKLKALIFPYDFTIEEVEKFHNELIEKGLIIVEEFEGEKWYRIKNFLKHQYIKKPSKSFKKSLEKFRKVQESLEKSTLNRNRKRKEKENNIINKEREKEIDKEKEKESEMPNGICQADKPLDATHLKSSLKSYEKTKETISFSEWIKEIIDYLNQKTGKHFTYDSDAIRRFMKARYQEGYSVQDAKVVILHKCETWGKDDKMREYIRPSTLFRATHFPEYLAEARKWYLDYLEKQGNYEKKEELEKIWFKKEEKVCNR